MPTYRNDSTGRVFLRNLLGTIVPLDPGESLEVYTTLSIEGLTKTSDNPTSAAAYPYYSEAINGTNLDSKWVLVRQDGDFYLRGTSWEGVIELRRSYDGGVTYGVVSRYEANTEEHIEVTARAWYQWIFTTHTSGEALGGIEV